MPKSSCAYKKNECKLYPKHEYEEWVKALYSENNAGTEPVVFLVT